MTEFNSEADLDKSKLLQRQRLMYGDVIEFRDWVPDPHGLRVLLYGGPYAGRYGMVSINQVRAWVIGDYAYERQLDGTWEWSYDAYA